MTDPRPPFAPTDILGMLESILLAPYGGKRPEGTFTRCPSCAGGGHNTIDAERECAMCKGTGEVYVPPSETK